MPFKRVYLFIYLPVFRTNNNTYDSLEYFDCQPMTLINYIILLLLVDYNVMIVQCPRTINTYQCVLRDVFINCSFLCGF